MSVAAAALVLVLVSWARSWEALQEKGGKDYYVHLKTGHATWEDPRVIPGAKVLAMVNRSRSRSRSRALSLSLARSLARSLSFSLSLSLSLSLSVQHGAAE